MSARKVVLFVRLGALPTVLMAWMAVMAVVLLAKLPDVIDTVCERDDEAVPAVRCVETSTYLAVNQRALTLRDERALEVADSNRAQITAGLRASGGAYASARSERRLPGAAMAAGLALGVMFLAFVFGGVLTLERDDAAGTLRWTLRHWPVAPRGGVIPLASVVDVVLDEQTVQHPRGPAVVRTMAVVHPDGTRTALTAMWFPGAARTRVARARALALGLLR